MASLGHSHAATSGPSRDAALSLSDADRRLFRRTLIRVMAVQVAALVLLWLLQTCYAT